MLRILIATDLSPNADIALSRAIAVASENGATLRILHVHGEAVSEAQLVPTRLLLAGRRKALAPPDLADGGIAIRSGDAADGILAEAGTYDPDLIVLGAHGRMRLRDAFLGTTAQNVLRRADMPVLVARNGGLAPYRRILVACDSAHASERILRLAAGLASTTEVFAVHAFHGPFEAFVPEGALPEEIARSHRDAVEKAVRGVASSFGSVSFHSEARQGDVIDVIAGAAKDVRPDLLVFGTHGRQGLARALFDSITEDALAYFDFDILALRTGEDDDPTAF